MKTIEIEDSVFHTLAKRVIGFGDTPNEVIKRLLIDAEGGPCGVTSPVTPSPTRSPDSVAQKHSFIEFVEAPEFLRGDFKSRYFDVLRYLYTNHPADFEKLDGYKRGRRVQISKDPSTIEKSGRSTNPQKLDGTPYWVLSNLSNPRKRSILEDILRLFKYPKEIITAVIKSIPDSDISRPRHFDPSEYQ
ncbi:MAG: SeqA protein [Pedosphaera sp.]|nr:SeqA protein [Pedosphaera sp.]